MRHYRVFVYGSLKRGFVHHDVVQGARFERTATVSGFELRIVGPYPAMVPRAGEQVHGEVYEVDERMLSVLDDFEDCPALYQRQTVELDDDSEAFAYTMFVEATADAPVVAGGDWRER